MVLYERLFEYPLRLTLLYQFSLKGIERLNRPIGSRDFEIPGSPWAFDQMKSPFRNFHTVMAAGLKN